MNKIDDKQDEDECRRQSLALQGDPQEAYTLAWLAAAADTEGWENETESLTRDRLEAMVPIVCGLVNLADIPEPYRSEFSRDSMGSTLPDAQGSHYVWDWHKWLTIRFTPEIKRD